MQTIAAATETSDFGVFKDFGRVDVVQWKVLMITLSLQVSNVYTASTKMILDAKTE